MSRWGFRRGGSASYPDLMAHRSHIIAVAAEVVLDKRIRGIEAKCAAAAERVGGSAADRASAEYFTGCLLFMLEEAEHGPHEVRQTLERHRLAEVMG